MHIKKFKIQGVRNLSDLCLELSPSLNIFYGDNGAGKSSLLEAIYLLSFGRSFRGSEWNHILHYRKNQCIIQIETEHLHRNSQMGLERHRSGFKQYRLNEKKTHRLADISRQLPIQFMSPYSHRLFTDGPQLRRQYVDWGLFHVEPSFYPLWKEFQKTLKQRNSALKARVSQQEMNFWDQKLSELSEELDSLRKIYTEYLENPLFNLLNTLISTQMDLNLSYFRGWDANIDLKSLLKSEIERDQQLGYTQYGPQRADLRLLVNNMPAENYFSQGQQKLAAYAFHLAQGKYLYEKTGIAPVYFIDDLPSELDPHKQVLILEELNNMGAQVLITGIELQNFRSLFHHTPTSLQTFHVKQGTIAPHSFSPCENSVRHEVL